MVTRLSTGSHCKGAVSVLRIWRSLLRWLGGSKDISDTEIELWQDALAKIRRDKTLDRIFNKYHLKELSTQQ